jgi:hypothetical protein
MLGIVMAFSIAMGFLETAVVIYIRELYYPEGFDFPLKMMSKHVTVTELFRELATLIMLVSVGILAGRTKTERFSYFIYSFAIWDIFYYIFLKLFVDWPLSLLSWDILFLIPTVWVGPVIAPVLLAILMVLFSFSISFFTDRSQKVIITKFEWLLLLFGSFVTIISFTKEYTNFILEKYSFSQLWNIDKSFIEYSILFIPENFPWYLFSIGFLIIFVGILKFNHRNYIITGKSKQY